MSSSLLRIIRMASPVKAVLLPKVTYEKISALLTRSGWFEELDDDPVALPGVPADKALLTEGMHLWSTTPQKPVPGILTERELEGDFGTVKIHMDLYDAAKRYFKRNPAPFKAGEAAAKAFLKTPEGKALGIVS